MTGATDEIWQALEPADALPHGRARIARLETLTARADELGDPQLSTAVRVSMIPACLYGGEHQRVPGLLTWLLERYAESPSWFGTWDRHSVLFSFNWATVGLLQHPDVPLAQLEQTLATMAEHYQAAGESMAPVLRAQFQLTLHVAGPQRAQEAFDAWILAGRSPLSECLECERAEQVRQWAALGDHQRAVDLAMPVLDGVLAVPCEAQPVAMIAASLTSLLEIGQAERAAHEHVRAVRLIRSRYDTGAAEPEGQTGRADHLLICARSGRLQRGLELIESWLPWYAQSGLPTARLETAAAAGRVLRGLAEAGHGHLVLTAGHGIEPTTVDELGARLAHEARDLGARFDTRNGTTTIGDQVERVLDAGPLPDLPLDALTRSPRSARVRRPAAAVNRGRRAAGRNAAPVVPTDDVRALAAMFDDGLKTDSRAQCNAVLDAWRELRTMPVGPDSAQAAARLDGWLALEELTLPSLDRTDIHQILVNQHSVVDEHSAVAQAAQACQRLLSAGLPIEALLLEQAFLLAAAPIGLVDLSLAAQRIQSLAIEISRTGGGADTGLALSRLALIRELAATAGHQTGGFVPEADPVDAGLAALDAVPTEQLSHQHLRAICRMLRLRARDEPPQEAIKTLFGAVAVLPDGVRPLERALAGADLAAALQVSDPATALTAWEQAITDAETAGAVALLGNLLAAGAALRRTLGDPGGTAADLTRAIPLLDEHAAGPLGAQARVDLSRVLLDLNRPVEAAEVAEAALADLTELVQMQELDRDLLGDGSSGSGSGPGDRALIYLTGAAAYTGAQANAAIGSPDSIDRARSLAMNSAAWHHRGENLIPQAEAWQFAAQLGGPPAQVAADLGRAADLAEVGGDWPRAATCRRERITALNEAEGIDIALAALADADAALDARLEYPAGRQANQEEHRLAYRLLRWHRLAVAEQRARMLAVSGRFREAMVAVTGLAEEFHELGDDWSARDLMGLRGQLRAQLDDLDGALDDLRQAAEAAETAGDPAQAQGLAERLAAVLAEAGRSAEAEAAWKRFTPSP